MHVILSIVLVLFGDRVIGTIGDFSSEQLLHDFLPQYRSSDDTVTVFIRLNIAAFHKIFRVSDAAFVSK